MRIVYNDRLYMPSRGNHVVQIVNLLCNISGLTATDWVSVVAAVVMIKNVSESRNGYLVKIQTYAGA